jgi:hypothetical protein
MAASRIIKISAGIFFMMPSLQANNKILSPFQRTYKRW